MTEAIEVTAGLRLSAERYVTLPAEERQAFLDSLSPQEAVALQYDWEFWARDKQLPPADPWRVWLLLAGRGFGKTRCGAEWVRREVQSGRKGHFALVGRTAADVRDVMVQGPSGLLSISSPHFMPTYQITKRRLVWPNGATAHCYSADEPDMLRGPQHDGAWADELASWQRPEAWDMLMFGLRMGNNPQACVTTTPRPTKVILDLRRDSKPTPLHPEPAVRITTGSSWENRANLAPTFFDDILRKYAGTRLGLQEIEAKILDDNPDSLWTRDQLDRTRVVPTAVPPLHKLAVAIDPSVHDGGAKKRARELEERAECGIMVGGVGHVPGGRDRLQGYLLEDVSTYGAPHAWATVGVRAYYRHRADGIVAEANNGGEMVREVIRGVDKRVPVTLVHASRGKLTRAEPVSNLYERGLIHHVGEFTDLEEQLVSWMPGDDSPDRLDALVWLFTHLLGGKRGKLVTVSGYGQGSRATPRSRPLGEAAKARLLGLKVGRGR